MVSIATEQVDYWAASSRFGWCKKYTYEALDVAKRQIRVLKMNPQSGVLLKCTMETIPLNEESRDNYEAVMDSLCINQADSTEKETQILLMRDVYRGARGVIAWFGDSREGTGAITILKQMTTTGQPGEEELQHIIHGLFSYELHSWQKVIEFLRHKYFTRMWMIQEVA